MTGKKQFDAEQIWFGMMVLMPMVVLTRLAGEVTDSGGLEMLYSGLFGGIGGGMGALAYYLSKGKGTAIKLIATTVLIAVVGLVFYLIITQWKTDVSSTDEVLLEQEWITQRIGHIEFETPIKLVLESEEIPEEAFPFIKELNTYSDNNPERSTLFIQSILKQDTQQIETNFFGSLNGMLGAIGVDMSEVKLRVLWADEQDLSVAFKFERNNDSLGGYGYMLKRGFILESVWLMPAEKGFSDEYVDAFEFRIMPYKEAIKE